MVPEKVKLSKDLLEVRITHSLVFSAQDKSTKWLRTTRHQFETFMNHSLLARYTFKISNYRMRRNQWIFQPLQLKGSTMPGMH